MKKENFMSSVVVYDEIPIPTIYDIIETSTKSDSQSAEKTTLIKTTDVSSKIFKEAVHPTSFKAIATMGSGILLILLGIGATSTVMYEKRLEPFDPLAMLCLANTINGIYLSIKGLNQLVSLTDPIDKIEKVQSKIFEELISDTSTSSADEIKKKKALNFISGFIIGSVSIVGCVASLYTQQIPFLVLNLASAINGATMIGKWYKIESRNQ